MFAAGDVAGRAYRALVCRGRLAWRQQATRTYAAVLGANALWLHSAPARLAHAALGAASTNLDHLSSDPISVLVTSACWVAPGGAGAVLGVVAFFVLVAAPLEARIGPRRWLVCFAAGHVGATLVVAAGLVLAVRADIEPTSIARHIDVGWSYGGFALAAALAFQLRSPWRWLVAGGLTVSRLVALVHPTFTDWGHLTALVIGFALGVRWRVAPRGRRAAGCLPATDAQQADPAAAVGRTAPRGRPRARGGPATHG